MRTGRVEIGGAKPGWLRISANYGSDPLGPELIKNKFGPKKLDI